jgi:transketolase
MAAIGNAYANYGIFLPFTSTFFVFSDYMKPAVRIAALMGAKQYFVWTHDSIGVGEDGPTHQPIEHLSQFRALPNFYTFRPADASENIACWEVALKSSKPCGFVLSRQKLKTLKPHFDFGSPKQGGYLVKRRENAKITIIATGSELMPSLFAGCHLEEMGVNANIVSVPCFELFLEQDREYIEKVIDKNTKVLAVEASSGLEWYRFADDVMSMESFGASAPVNELFKKYGFSTKDIKKRALKLLGIEDKETNSCEA